MSRQSTIRILVIASCGLVAWAFWSGRILAPGPGIGGDVSATIRSSPKIPGRVESQLEVPRSEGYGSITGRVVFVGEIPILPPLIRVDDEKVKKEDRAICAAEEIPDESLLVDGKTRGIANVFVFLPQATHGIHPLREKSVEKRVVGEVVGCRYVPHVLFARTDQDVVVRFRDAIPHNLHEHAFRNERFSRVIVPLPKNGELQYAHRDAELRPISVQCDFHPWMRAWWLILDHPYAAISDAQGKFAIADLPAGTYAFQVWHEKPGVIHKALQVVVKADQTTDLGEIEVSAARLREDASGN